MKSIRHATEALDKKLERSFPLKNIKTSKIASHIGHDFVKVLDRLEHIPVLFGKTPEVENQKKEFEFYLKFSQKVELLASKYSKLEVKADKKTRPMVKGLSMNLSLRVVALKYRIEATNGGLDKAPISIPLYKDILNLAGEWKISQKMYAKEDVKLSPRDIEKMKELASYPEFCALLKKDKALQEHFFGWAIRDNNGVSQFIQYPAISQKIDRCYLAERIGRFVENLFRIEKLKKENSKDEVLEKVVTLPFETVDGVKNISILDDRKKIELKGSWKLTIKEIFKEFARKHDQTSELEFFATTGVTNWNSYNLGRYNPATLSYDRIDFDETNWQDKFPVLEVIPQEEVVRRYGEFNRETKGQVFVVSQRSRSDSDVTKRHSYFMIAVKDLNGKYKMIPIGLYPISFPQKAIDNIKFLAATVLAKVIFPDLNYFLPRRELASHPLKLNDEQFDQILQAIGKDILSGLKGNLTFKFIDENCSRWTQEIVTGVVKDQNPNYFEMEVIHSHPKDAVMKGLFSSFRAMPPKIRGLTIKFLLTVLGGRKKTKILENGKVVKKSVLSGDKNKYDRLKIFNPCVLFDAIKKNKRSGKISFGY